MKVKRSNFKRQFQFLIQIYFLGVSTLSFSQCDLFQGFSNEELELAEYYQQIIRDNSPLFNGRVYQHAQYSQEQHPYFFKNDWYEGTILYNDILYPKVWMKYDLVDDVIIVRNGNGQVLSLDKSKIELFELFGNSFFKFSYPKSPQEGFFQIKACGQVSFLISIKKQSILKGINDYEFKEVKDYYFLQDDLLTQVKNKKTVFAALFDRHDEIKTFIKDSNLYFSTHREALLQGIVEYYNSIN